MHVPQRIYHLLQELIRLTHRTGLWWVNDELEECLFRLRRPDRYRSLRFIVGSRRHNRETIRTIVSVLQSTLEVHGIHARITGRAKRMVSIHRKLERAGVPLDEIHDIRALRIIVDDVPTCYAALRVIHRIYRPIPGKLDDYIAQPKHNGYRSLHTAAFDEAGRPFEVQIRTRAMHRIAQLGSAAHWRYKESTAPPAEPEALFLEGAIPVAQDQASEVDEPLRVEEAIR
jgi:(p)ppGpp synthase/HD superfamily hydrolase